MSEKKYTLEDMKTCFFISRGVTQDYCCEGDEVDWRDYQMLLDSASKASQRIDCSFGCAAQPADGPAETTTVASTESIKRHIDQVEKNLDYKLKHFEIRLERMLSERFVDWRKLVLKSVAYAARSTLISALASRKPYFEEFAERLEKDSE